MITNIGWPFNSLIGNVYLPFFHEKGEAALQTFVNLSVPRLAFLAAYKTLPPIEEMDAQEKKEMKEYVLEKWPEKTPEEQIEACKVVYTVGTLI